MPVLQGRLKGKRWIAGSHTHGCWLGSYEYDKQLLFERTIADGDIVFDIGANAGFYSLLASVLVGPQGAVYAFEPLPKNLVYLKEHLRLNQIENVNIIEAAVSDFSGVASFDSTPGSAMGHLAITGKLQVKTVKLDDLFAGRQIPLPTCLKIDIEGGELHALKGATSMLAEARPQIFLATHGKEMHRQCCELLHSLNYDLATIGVESLEEADEVHASPRT